MSSTIITCNREVSKGKVCGKPIAPVFGAYPEECTSCAMRVMVNTKEAREAFKEILEQHRTILRRLVIAASVPGNDWRVDGLELRSRFWLLDALEENVVVRQKMRALNIAQRISNQPVGGKKTNEIRRTNLGHMWNTVSADRATELKKSGFEVRYIGVAWQVKVS